MSVLLLCRHVNVEPQEKITVLACSLVVKLIAVNIKVPKSRDSVALKSYKLISHMSSFFSLQYSVCPKDISCFSLQYIVCPKDISCFSLQYSV